MRLGAGLVAALALAVSLAGWWTLAAIALAAVAAALSARITTEPRHPAARGLRIAARGSLVVVYATVFAAYLVPGEPRLGAAGFVVVVTVAHAAGLHVDRTWRRWITGVLLVAAAAFVAVCLAIPSVAAPATGVAWPGAGVVSAAAVLFPLLAGPGRIRLVTATAVALALAAAALYQLGPVRLGLSPTSLVDALAAADAVALQPLLKGVVVLATVAAAFPALEATRDALGSRAPSRAASPWLCGAGAAAGAALLTPFWALVAAAALSLADVLAGLLRGRDRGLPTLVTAVVVPALLAGLAVVPLR